MDAYVKSFIEDNIDSIDNHEFEELFVSWYEYTPYTNPYVDREHFMELENTLIEAEVFNTDEVRIQYNDARIKILLNKLEYHIEGELSNNAWRRDRYKLMFDSIYSQMSSFLGLGVADIIELLQTEFDDYGFEVGSGYYIVE